MFAMLGSVDAITPPCRRQAAVDWQAEVVGLLLEARNQIARAIEDQHDQTTTAPRNQSVFHKPAFMPPSRSFGSGSLGRIVAAKLRCVKYLRGFWKAK